MRTIRSVLISTAAVAGVGLGGAALASAASSSTGSPTTVTTSSTLAPPSGSGTAGPYGRPPANFPAHGTPGHETAEKTVTGADATEAEAAAVKYLGGGTATGVTTDCTRTGYEVMVTKGGTTTEVHLDSAFAVRADGTDRPGSGPAPSGSSTPSVTG